MAKRPGEAELAAQASPAKTRRRGSAGSADGSAGSAESNAPAAALDAQTAVLAAQTAVLAAQTAVLAAQTAVLDATLFRDAATKLFSRGAAKRNRLTCGSGGQSTTSDTFILSGSV